MSKIDWRSGLGLERDVAILIKEQEKTGVFFNLPKAKYYISLLDKMKDDCYEKIRPKLNYEVINKELKKKGEDEYSYVSKIRNKNGEYTRSVTSWFDDYSIVDGCFSRVYFEEPSISKRGCIIKQLLKLGWKPKEFTDKGFPRLTNKDGPVDTLESVGDIGKELSLWYVYNHRQSQISGFLEHVRPDHRISAQMNSCATNTFRAAHKVVANIPRPTSVFGKEMRSLFTVEPGRRFVGADVSGLELRMLAHYMNDPEYISQILSGDIHIYNMKMAGLYTRDQAKTFIYAFIYGGGDPKIGEIIGGSAKAGREIKERFFTAIPALSKLFNKVRSFAERTGYIPSIDLRKIYIRRYEGKLLVHTALNALLQASGSIVTKRAMVMAADRIKELRLDARQIIFYHDEFAYDSSEDCAEEVGKILVDSMRLAGEYYNLRIPISGEYKVGIDWSIH
ncbi:DNA polymerase [Caudoviricetes sp.]|nr:DNA polymerase [Caudoviricetes sp.]